ncbi:hypothetical protein ACM64Y_11020 [Novispirillum sp. DQ9]|uniref:hypothetical protein n=1 Tax=Novispirillum sp. DQ9 TaxID=3398612 RepID=UPI003C7E2234
MAFQSKNLSVLAYANGFTLWHYATPDAAATVTAANYFDAAADMMRGGDVVVANVNTAATPAAVFYRVATSTNGVVSIAAM